MSHLWIFRLQHFFKPQVNFGFWPLIWYPDFVFSGAISIAEYLDREKVDVYSLVVTAKDGGNKVCVL